MELDFQENGPLVFELCLGIHGYWDSLYDYFRAHFNILLRLIVYVSFHFVTA